MSILNDIQSAINGTVNVASPPQGPTILPWQLSGITNNFFKSIDIDPTRWNQLFPYRLLVVNVGPSGALQIVNGPALPANIKVSGNNTSAIIDFTPVSSQWIFQLPITPQQLSITDQFAIVTSATLRGVIEEHSGVRFKMINASGTMGVWPYRTNADPKVSTSSSQPGILGQVFAGTLQAASNFVSQVQGVVNTITSGTAANKPKTVQPAQSAAGQNSVSLYIAQQLQQFLEQYAEAKLDPANAGWRLVFDIPKQNQSFVVTPVNFTWQQSESRPLEVMYNMQFKAWRRIDIGQVGPVALTTPALNANILAQILNTITNARTALASATNLIGAVTSDIEAPLNILRQSALFVKDLAGVAVSVADLPFRIQSDYASSIKQSISILSNAITSSSTDPTVAQQVAQIQASVQQNEGLTDAAVAGGQLGTAAANALQTDPTTVIFQNPAQNFALLDNVKVTDLTLTAAQQNIVTAAIDSAKNYTVNDINTFKAGIQSLATQLANSFGAGDSYYNSIFGLAAPTTRIQPMTLDEYDLLDALYQTIQSYDLLTANSFINDQSIQSSMDYVAGLASVSDIEFTVPNSMTLMPVPFGLTMEQIAARYLGDAQRWLEIATLNNLREPYIDEDGFQYPLLSNGYGRQVTVASDTNLYLGQIVTVMSATQIPSPRTILGIKTLSSSSYLLTLDGNADLDTFTLQDKAYIQAYLPGTVNSQQKIFIPNNAVVSQEPAVTTPAIANTDPLTGLSKVDLLLTDQGDIAVNNYGDFRIAYGITNIVQALRIKVGTLAGKMLLHPTFGVGVSPGAINSTVSAQDLYNSFSDMILADPRFASIQKLQIVLNGPSLTINVSVLLPGISGIFPISFKLAS